MTGAGILCPHASRCASSLPPEGASPGLGRPGAGLADADACAGRRSRAAAREYRPRHGERRGVVGRYGEGFSGLFFAMRELSDVATQLDLTTAAVGIAALVVFLLAYAVVIGEEYWHLRKSMPVLVAAGIIWAASHRIFDPQPIEQVGLGLALSVGSSILNGLLAWVMFDAAKRHRSIALEADAKHLVTDVWTSVGVVIGIAMVSFTGWLWLDAVVAIGVALNILKEGVHLIWRSSQGLMDEAVEPEVIAKIQETLAGFAHQRDEISIIRFDHVTTRKAGQRRFVDLHMHMPASWTLGRAAALRTSVEQALMSAVPGLRASIQLLPSDVEAHFDSERDLL